MIHTSHTVLPKDPPKDETAWKAYLEREARIDNGLRASDTRKYFSPCNQCTNQPVKI